MRFADFRAGQAIELGPIAVSDAEIVEFARRWDPQWFHTDPARARESRWHGLIASGWHTCAIAMRAVVEQLLRDSESIGSPGLAYLKWPAPVRPGDALTLRLDVLETRTSSSGRIGSVRWRWQLVNQAGAIALDTEATSLFELAGAR